MRPYWAASACARRRGGRQPFPKPCGRRCAWCVWAFRSLLFNFDVLVDFISCLFFAIPISPIRWCDGVLHWGRCIRMFSVSLLSSLMLWVFSVDQCDCGLWLSYSSLFLLLHSFRGVGIHVLDSLPASFSIFDVLVPLPRLLVRVPLIVPLSFIVLVVAAVPVFVPVCGCPTVPSRRPCASSGWR